MVMSLNFWQPHLKHMVKTTCPFSSGAHLRIESLLMYWCLFIPHITICKLCVCPTEISPSPHLLLVLGRIVVSYSVAGPTLEERAMFGQCNGNGGGLGTMATAAASLHTLAAPSWLGLSPCGLGCALADAGLRPHGLGCALVAWLATPLWLGLRLCKRWAVPSWLCVADHLGCRAVSFQTLAAPSWLGLRPHGLVCTLADAGLCPCGLGCTLVAWWASPSWLRLRLCRCWIVPLWLGLHPRGLVDYALVAWVAPLLIPGCSLVAVHGRSLGVSLKLLGLISCENLWLLIARHSALQERGANDKVIRSLA